MLRLYVAFLWSIECMPCMRKFVRIVQGLRLVQEDIFLLGVFVIVNKQHYCNQNCNVWYDPNWKVFIMTLALLDLG